jgi:hypothetical protein
VYISDRECVIVVWAGVRTVELGEAGWQYPNVARPGPRADEARTKHLCLPLTANDSHHHAEPLPGSIVSTPIRARQDSDNQNLAYMLHQTLQLSPYAPYACTIVRPAHHNQTPWVWR